MYWRKFHVFSLGLRILFYASLHDVGDNSYPQFPRLYNSKQYLSQYYLYQDLSKYI